MKKAEQAERQVQELLSWFTERLNSEVKEIWRQYFPAFYEFVQERLLLAEVDSHDTLADLQSQIRVVEAQIKEFQEWSSERNDLMIQLTFRPLSRFAICGFILFMAVHRRQGFQAFGTSKQPNSWPQKVGKLASDVFDHLDLKGDAVFCEHGVEIGCGYDHFRYLSRDNALAYNKNMANIDEKQAGNCRG